MKLTAVIATANRAKELDDAFKTFITQTQPFDEIIIADSSDGNETEKLVEEWSSRLPLINLKCDVLSAAVQRDLGVNVSTGDIIFFLDDDILLEERYVEEIARIFENDKDGQIGGVSGTIVNQTYGNPSWITRQYFRFLAGEYRESYSGSIIGPGVNMLPEDSGQDIKGVEWMPTCSCAYRKDAIKSVGGFGNFFKGYSMCEDIYLSTCVAQGWKLVNTRKARLYHKDLGGKSHKNWREIGEMSVINRWMVVRDVMKSDTLSNKFKLAISLLYSWVSTLRNILRGKEDYRIAKKRVIGQFTGYIVVLRNNGFINNS